MFTSKPFEVAFAWLIALKEKDGGLREGPLEMGVTDLFTVGAVFFAVGFFDTLDQAAIGDEILDCGEAIDGFDFVENDQREDSTHSGDCLKQGVGA